MEENHAILKTLPDKFFFFEKEKPRQPAAFQQVRRGLSVLER